MFLFYYLPLKVLSQKYMSPRRQKVSLIEKSPYLFIYIYYTYRFWVEKLANFIFMQNKKTN